MKRLALILTLIATGAFAQVEPLDIQTRGQAQIVARRHARDDAEAQMLTELGLILIGEQPLSEWLANHPDADLAIRRAIRRAEVTTDDAESGMWVIGLEVPISDIRDALPASVRDDTETTGTRALTARGRAPIPWEGADANISVLPRPPVREEINLPSIDIETAPAPTPIVAAPPRPVRVDLTYATWRSDISMTTTGTGRTTSAALNGALREMETTIRNLPVGPETTVGDWAASSPQREQAVQAAMGQATESDRRLTPEGVCEVDLTIPLRGLRTALEESRP